jgi:PAS domain S-box-containing protein
MNNILLKEQRCSCGKLLLKGIFLQANLEIKCKKCGKISQIGSLRQCANDRQYLLVVDSRGIIANADTAASSFLGYSHDELLGKHFSEIDTYLPKEIGEKLMPPNSILSPDDYFQIDSYNLTKEGQKLAVNVLLKLYKPTSEEVYVLASVTVKNEDMQVTSKNTFREHACDFYFDLDKNGICKAMSASIEELFGISQKVGIGANYYDFVAEDKKIKTIERFQYFVIKEQPYRILDHIGIDSKGNTTCSDLFFTPNFNSDGKFIGYRVLGWLKKP